MKQKTPIAGVIKRKGETIKASPYFLRNMKQYKNQKIKN